MNRIERYSLLAASTAISFLAIASPVSATIIEYESQAGATAPDDRPLGATATFTYDATCLTNCALTIELANTEPMTGISQALTDFHFTSTSITGLTLTGADGEQFVNCYHPGVNKPDQYCDAPTSADFDANSYGWRLTGSYVLAATPLTLAGIVSTPIDPNSDGTGDFNVIAVYFINTPGVDQPHGTITVQAAQVQRTANYLSGGMTFAPNSTAMSATVRVTSALFRTASSGLASISGTCLYAAA